MKHIRQSTFVPRVICTSANQTHGGILLDTCIACSAISIIRDALDEPSARFCAASVVIALDDLHKVVFARSTSISYIPMIFLV